MRVQQRGLTLVETAISLAVVAISTLGSLSYQYHAARQIHIAHAELVATRTGQLLVEDWKSTGGAQNYDPVALNIGFAQDPTSTYYLITVDGVRLSVWLVALDEDMSFGGSLRRITVTLRWRANFDAQPPTASDPIVVFTTYVRRGLD
jgi:Tfp pilus assembly protein PilV